MAIQASTRFGPSRRAVLTGAAALPALPAMALPALAHEDDEIEALLRCAVETGLSLDLLYAATRGLSRADRDRVLGQLAALSERLVVIVCHPESRLAKAVV